MGNNLTNEQLKKRANEAVYLLKGGALYNLSESEGSRLVQRYSGPFSIAEIMGNGERFELVIDDSYFFYVQVGKLSLSRKKVRIVVSNYVQATFPADLFADFALSENKGVYTALLYREDLQNLIKNEQGFFRQAKRITTAFCEISLRYPSFQFTDGEKVYDKSEDAVKLLVSKPEGTLEAKDMWHELIPLRTEITIPGVQKSRGSLGKYQTLVFVVAACYLMFLAAGIFSILAELKVQSTYERTLGTLYKQAGVDNQPDPYGALIAKTKRTTLAPYRVMNVMKTLGEAIPDNVTIESFSVADKTVRIEGYTKTFADMEKLKPAIENKVKKQVVIEDSRQSGDQIKFTIRYEP